MSADDKSTEDRSRQSSLCSGRFRIPGTILHGAPGIPVGKHLRISGWISTQFPLLLLSKLLRHRDKMPMGEPRTSACCPWICGDVSVEPTPVPTSSQNRRALRGEGRPTTGLSPQSGACRWEQIVLPQLCPDQLFPRQVSVLNHVMDEI